VSTVAIERRSRVLAKLFWLGVGAVSIALRHPWLGGFFLASVTLSTWLRLLALVVYRDEPPPKDTKERRLRAMIFTVSLVSGGLVIARALSPLWR